MPYLKHTNPRVNSFDLFILALLSKLRYTCIVINPPNMTLSNTPAMLHTEALSISLKHYLNNGTLDECEDCGGQFFKDVQDTEHRCHYCRPYKCHLCDAELDKFQDTCDSCLEDLNFYSF